MNPLVRLLSYRAARSIFVYIVFAALYGARGGEVGEHDPIVTLGGVVAAGSLAWYAGREAPAPFLQYLAQLPLERRMALAAPWVTGAGVLFAAMALVAITECTGINRRLLWGLLGATPDVHGRAPGDCIVFLCAPIVWYWTVSAFLLRHGLAAGLGGLAFAAGVAAWFVDRELGRNVYAAGAAGVVLLTTRPLLVAAASRDLDLGPTPEPSCEF